MSLHLEFNPHSWYMGFAIKDERDTNNYLEPGWQAFTDDGNTYRIVDFQAKTLKRLKQKIRSYHLRKHNGYGEQIAARRLNEIREEIQAERISQSEIVELQGLATYIENDDVELLQWAGIKEGTR